MTVDQTLTNVPLSSVGEMDAASLLDAVFHHSRLLIAYLNPRFDFVLVNATFAEHDGRPADYYPGKNYLSLFPNADQEQCLRRVVTTGVAERMDAWRDDGPGARLHDRARWSWTVAPVLDATSNVVGVLLSLFDVSTFVESVTRNEPYYRHLVETASAIPWEADISSWQFRYVGPQATKILGYPVEQWYEHDFWEDHLHVDDRAWAPDYCRGATAQGKDHDFEYRMLSADGRIIWIRDSVQVLTSGDRVVGLQGFMFDITTRKQAEESLHRHEDLLRNVIANAPVVLWALDCDGVFTLSDGQGLEALGLAPGEMVGASALEAYKHEPRVLDYVRRALAGEALVAEISIDGHMFESHCSPTVEESGQVAGVIGVSIDITERKCAEDALRESEEKYRGIFDNAQVGLWRTRLSDGKLLECNDRFANMFGFPHRDDAIGCYVASERYLDDGTRERMLSRLRTDGEVTNFEARMTRNDGSLIWIRYTAKAFDERGYLEGIATDITDEKSAIERLKASECELSNILNSMQDTYYRADGDGVLLRASDSAERLLGYTTEELLGRRITDFYVDPGRREDFLEALQREGGRVHSYETALRHKDGHTVWVWSNAQFLYDLAGNVVGVEGTARDVTERRHAEVWMRKLSSALEQTAEMVMITDVQGVIEYVNPAFENVTGYRKAEVMGRTPSVLRSGNHDTSFYQHVWSTIQAGEVLQEVFINRRNDGSEYYEEKIISPVKDGNGNVTHFVSTGKDITERMQTQERLQYLAHHDVLTGLPNRALFADRLEHALARSRGREYMVAVLFLDLDRFKVINDTLGHDVGDFALQESARRLRSCVRDGDTIARLGGDEFAIILEDIRDADSVAPVATKLIDAFSQPFEYRGRELYITASIGVSMEPLDGEDPKTLLRHADIAMYRAKEQGRNTYRFYSADMSVKAFERLSMETNLRHALQRGEFILHYQPQTDLVHGKIVAVEALVRWQHPELGLVSPADFVPILEETGLIFDLGEWALVTACRQVRSWQQCGHDSIYLAVNLSSRQFNAPGLAQMVARTLEETGLDASFLELEITEGVLVQNNLETMETFGQLLKMNVRLAIDDFGTGYSSLSYLKRFSIDTLKIDRAFIGDVTRDPDDAAIVEAIIAMAKRLNISVVAEGVETEQQLQFLREQACDLVQGFLISAPLSVDEMGARLACDVGVGK